MNKISDAELVSIVDNEFENAMGAEGGEISTERAKAWNYYLSKKFGDEKEGQSQVVTANVAEVVDGTMPSLTRRLKTSVNLVNFGFVGSE